MLSINFKKKAVTASFFCSFEFIDIPGMLLYDTANGTAISSTYTPF